MSPIKPLYEPKIRTSQRGMVSIMTTMVLMIVISLIVLGFAQISRRNQKESLDRQLSTQAFYAAESGINDARKIIDQAVHTGGTVTDKTDCGGTGTAGFYVGLSPDIDTGRNVKYTCLLVDPTPKTLEYNNLGTTTTIVPVISANSDPISTIKLTWKSKLATATPTTGCGNAVGSVSFTSVSSWSCGYGVLRFDIVPTAGSFATPADLANATMTTFAVPITTSGSGTVGYNSSSNSPNNKIGVSCTNDNCNLTINGLSQTSYHLRISSLYRDVSLQITATNAGGNTLRIAGAQAVIDSTGKAQDVLRRIQVHVPLRSTSQNELSDYAIESNGSVCKRYSIMDGYISNNVSAGSGRLCQNFSSP